MFVEVNRQHIANGLATRVTREGNSRRISSVIFRRKIIEEKVVCHTREKITADFSRDFRSRPRKSSSTTDFGMIIKIIASRGTSHGISRAKKTIFQYL